MYRGHCWPGEPCASSTQMVRRVPRSWKGRRVQLVNQGPRDGRLKNCMRLLEVALDN